MVNFIIKASSILSIFAYLYIELNFLKITRYKVLSEKIPNAFKGYKILQISDLHNKTFGKENKRLFKIICSENPSIIVITGDIINRRIYDDKEALNLVKKLTSKYDVYYVTGNHEVWSNKYEELRPKLLDTGVKILNNETIKLFKGDEYISLIGIDDPGKGFYSKTEKALTLKYLDFALNNVSPDCFKVLLAHRPEYFSIYANNEIDLILSGHAHGGQVRIPFLGAIYIPNQPFFSKLSKGKFIRKNSTMIISGGLGTSKLPIRAFNLPEVVTITLN